MTPATKGRWRQWTGF